MQAQPPSVRRCQHEVDDDDIVDASFDDEEGDAVREHDDDTTRKANKATQTEETIGHLNPAQIRVLEKVDADRLFSFAGVEPRIVRSLISRGALVLRGEGGYDVSDAARVAMSAQATTSR